MNWLSDKVVVSQQNYIILHFDKIHICLNPIVEWVQLTIQKLLKYEKLFVEINVFLTLIFSNRRCGTRAMQMKIQSNL
jgi:hypothetical protein